MEYPIEVARLVAAIRSEDVNGVYVPTINDIIEKIGPNNGHILVLNLVQVIDLLLQGIVKLNNKSLGVEQTVEDILLQFLDIGNK